MLLLWLSCFVVAITKDFAFVEDTVYFLSSISLLVRWPAPVRFCGAPNDHEWGRGPTSAQKQSACVYQCKTPSSIHRWIFAKRILIPFVVYCTASDEKPKFLCGIRWNTLSVIHWSCNSTTVYLFFCCPHFHTGNESSGRDRKGQAVCVSDWI